MCGPPAVVVRSQERGASLRPPGFQPVTRRHQRGFTGVILMLDPEAAPSAAVVGTVLVADDDVAIRETLRAILELADHEVLVAEDGEEVRRILAEHDIDVLVLDLTMPRVDGWAVLRALGRRRPVVIVHTGNVLSPSDIAEFLEFRPFGVLAKPVPPARMLAAVADAVAEARASA